MRASYVFNTFTIFLLVLAAAFNESTLNGQDVSNVKSDERIVFFTTDASLSQDGTTWTVPIHAWVYEYDRATARRATIAAALWAKYGLKATPQTKPNFDRRTRLVVADNERGKRIVIKMAGKRFALPETQPNGHTSGIFQVDASRVSTHASGKTLPITAILVENDRRTFAGRVNLIPRDGISVISDLDDTVKITHATDRAKMLDHTFYRDFQAVPGMASLYAAWADRDAALHFVSSSPWHLYQPLNEFLTAAGFPARSMSLKHFRFKDSTLMNLFLKGTETKPAQIQPILEAFPARRFILVGDSGQEDPEVYAEFMKQYPDQIVRVYIRNVTDASPGDERFRTVFNGIDPAKWKLFTDPAELTLPDMPWVRISEDGKGFVLGDTGQRFVPWGFNYDHEGDGELLEDYWDEKWPLVESAFTEMKQLGANVVRIHLQFGSFMESASQPRQSSLDQLARLLRLAETTGLYIDLTGLGCYHKQDVPEWYDALGEQERWAAQAVFWESVAKTCCESPAIFCYDLMNEPVVPGGDKKRDDWLGPGFAGKHFVQFVSLDRRGRQRPEVARQWIGTLVSAIRKHDSRHLVTVGLVPWSLDRPGLTSGFDPIKIADQLDFIAMHLYPESGKVDQAIETLKGFAAAGKPVVIEETFTLKCGADDLRLFLQRSTEHATGWIGFYWGKTPDEIRPAKSIAEAVTLSWLELFQEMKPAMVPPGN